MKIGVPRETEPGERRAALVPEGVKLLVKLGIEVQVETGLGQGIRISDDEYALAGAILIDERRRLLADSDVILRVRKPPRDEVSLLKAGAVHVSFLDPFNEPELIESLAQAQISAISMEMIPRTTQAQKMDALSSQTNLAGYVSVILAAEAMDRIFPMMTTPAGTLTPVRVFVIGAGVAGLQAIATAKRLGAMVEAYDTRPVVEEQVKSLGARFVSIDLGETGQTREGYAKALTEEQIARQRQEIAKFCARADVVITTAQLFGRKAPLIVTAEAVRGMKPGSVLVDLAVESGGNIAGSVLDKVVDKEGVRIIGLGNLPSRVAVNASQLYSGNLVHLLTDLWDRERNELVLSPDSELMQACLITHRGAVCNERLQGASR